MKEKTHFRSCPKCGKQCGYVSACHRDYAESAGKVCRSCAHKGKTHSAETKAKMSAAHQGKAISLETRAKMSTAKSDETRAKMIAAKQSKRDAITKMYGVKAKRNQPALRKWAKQVKERDDYQCQSCGAEKTHPSSMHAHHIVPCEYFPELAYDLSNGITLCSSCHKKLHHDITRLTMAGIKLDAEGFREHYNGFMFKHSFLRPFIPSSVLDIELRSVSYLMQQTA